MSAIDKAVAVITALEPEGSSGARGINPKRLSQFVSGVVALLPHQAGIFGTSVTLALQPINETIALVAVSNFSPFIPLHLEDPCDSADSKQSNAVEMACGEMRFRLADVAERVLARRREIIKLVDKSDGLSGTNPATTDDYIRAIESAVWSNEDRALAICLGKWSESLSDATLVALLGIELGLEIGDGKFAAAIAPLCVLDPRPEDFYGKVTECDLQAAKSRIVSRNGKHTGSIRGELKDFAIALASQADVTGRSTRFVDIMGIRPTAPRSELMLDPHSEDIDDQ